MWYWYQRSNKSRWCNGRNGSWTQRRIGILFGVFIWKLLMVGRLNNLILRIRLHYIRLSWLNRAIRTFTGNKKPYRRIKKNRIFIMHFIFSWLYIFSWRRKIYIRKFNSNVCNVEFRITSFDNIIKMWFN